MGRFDALGASSHSRRSTSVFTALACASLVALSACAPVGGGEAPDVQVELHFDPAPAVGETRCHVQLEGPDGATIDGAVIQVEGNMNHAGMVPVFADLSCEGEGAYAAPFEFTMGGDWFVVIRGELPDGRYLERIIDVPSVPVEPGARSCCDVAVN